MKIFFDGDCYFCRNAVMLLRLREVVGKVELISLRDTKYDLGELPAGLNVDSGFVVQHNGQTFHGARALRYLAKLTEPQNPVSVIVSVIGASSILASLLYPVLVLGRFLLLAMQGGALIGDLSRREAGGADALGPRAVRIAALLVAMVGVIRLTLVKPPPASLFALAALCVLTALACVCWAVLFLRASLAERAYRRLCAASVRDLLIYAVIWLVAVNAADLIAVRRIIGFIVALPLLALAFDLFRKHRDRAGAVVAAAPLALAICALFPGLYLAPFYGGIGGWTYVIDRSQPVVVAGYKLVNRDGEEVWYNHAFFEPITQDGRFERAFSNGDSDPDHFMKFMLDNYRRIYPTLAKGRLPHQWLLGSFAYPCHNLCNNDTSYAPRFPPERIVEIRRVNDYYSRDGVFLRSETLFGWRP